MRSIKKGTRTNCSMSKPSGTEVCARSTLRTNFRTIRGCTSNSDVSSAIDSAYPSSYCRRSPAFMVSLRFTTARAVAAAFALPCTTLAASAYAEAWAATSWRRASKLKALSFKASSSTARSASILKIVGDVK